MSVIDLTNTIIAKSDQMNAEDLAGPKTIKVTKATKKEGSDQPVSIFYEGDNGKPWKPCKTMRRVIAKLWGLKIDMAGRQFTLMCDPQVTWAGQEVGGIRISHMSHIEKSKTVVIRTSKHKVAKFTVDVLEVEAAGKDLESEGLTAANGGVKSYTLWKDSLGSEDKASIKQSHSKWSEIALSVDAEDEPAL